MKNILLTSLLFLTLLKLGQAQEIPPVPKFLLVNFRVNPIKEKPDLESKTLILAPQNSKIEVIEIMDEFIHCRYNGFEGFAMKSRVSKTDLDGVKEYFDYVENLKQEERIRGYQKENEERLKYLTEKFGEVAAQKVLRKYVWIGMTEEMLIESWGTPIEVNRTITANRVNKQFIYSNSRYVYTDDGIVTAIQD